MSKMNWGGLGHCQNAHVMDIVKIFLFCPYCQKGVIQWMGHFGCNMYYTYLLTETSPQAGTLTVRLELRPSGRNCSRRARTFPDYG